MVGLLVCFRSSFDGVALLRTPSEVSGVISFLLFFIRIVSNLRVKDVTDSGVRLDRICLLLLLVRGHGDVAVERGERGCLL